MKKGLIVLVLAWIGCMSVMAYSRFVHLRTEDVQIDSVMPCTTYFMQLPENYQDSVYTVSVLYPEFINMTQNDILNYNRISGGKELPELPAAEWFISIDRKKPILNVCVVPLVYREKKYRWMTSFMLKIESTAKSKGKKRAMAKQQDASVYADHSKLAEGKWAKIRVANTGIYELSSSLIRQAGFSNLNKVRVYGYGGNMQPEAIQEEYLRSHDDLMEVPQCIVGDKHLFHAQGPVTWASKTADVRVRNPYSDYGYYFITEEEGDPLVIDADAFKAEYGSDPYYYHDLYENDEHYWFKGGRNLYDPKELKAGASQTFTLKNTGNAQKGNLTVSVTSGDNAQVRVLFNGQEKFTASITVSSQAHDKAGVSTRTVALTELKEENKVTLEVLSGQTVHLDYISMAYDSQTSDFSLSRTSYPIPEYCGKTDNQDLHADGACDMVIIIPTSGKLAKQAQRLKEFHEQKDGMRVRIIPANQLYNEFASGTPDANAYRRYLKMLYDRAGKNEADMPKYLLLFGACAWDNRMLANANAGKNPDDYLLCYESENSINETNCYTDDGWFTLLDEGEGIRPDSQDKSDVAVGRIPAVSESTAQVIVDKSINYGSIKNPGAWQNVAMVMGDDGNKNMHMEDANSIAEQMMKLRPDFHVKKVMWDAYTPVSSANGRTYPEVTQAIKRQLNEGALIMNFSGHGSPAQLTDESVLRLGYFQQMKNKHLPLWITASCDIAPFDSRVDNIGELALMNKEGGAFAFFGTTRLVFASYNKKINQAFTKYLLTPLNGKVATLGEAQRLAKNYLIQSGSDKTTNKLAYALLGDPALRLAIPENVVVVDAINGQNLEKDVTISAGQKVTVSGHIEGQNDFDGELTLLVRDSEEQVVCRMNDTSDNGTDKAFIFTDRTKVIFNGTTKVAKGKFTITFNVPLDINYSDDYGYMNLVAVSEDGQKTVSGYCDKFLVGGSVEIENNGKGPEVYCYLNKRDFKDGETVNAAPTFVAEIKDKDGINFSGTSIGHDLMLVVDNDPEKTYNLNSNFKYYTGSSTEGMTQYTIPALSEGQHSLSFRAWDLLNNATVAQLKFNVLSGMQPELYSIYCTENPASTSTTFIITHDRMASDMDIRIEVMDMTGRTVWTKTLKDVSENGQNAVVWDLSTGDGAHMQTGIYLYRVSIASEGSKFVSKAKKLVVLK